MWVYLSVPQHLSESVHECVAVLRWELWLLPDDLHRTGPMRISPRKSGETMKERLYSLLRM